MEHWIEIELERTFEFQYQRFLLEFIKPVVDELSLTRCLETFHFFFEENKILFRVETLRKSQKQLVKQIVLKYALNVRDLIEFKAFRDYSGEIDKYGVDGWKLVKRLYELAGLVAIALHAPSFKKGNMFLLSKFIHCFLNTLGYTPTTEMLFYLFSFITLILKWLNKKTLDLEAERKVREVFDTVLSSLVPNKQ